jgi:hypothetical protein
MPIILGSWEAEIDRTKAQDQSNQKVVKTLSYPISQPGVSLLSSQLSGRHK